MSDEQWRRIADRIESTWPGEPGAGDRYREELGDLDPEAVDAALDGLLIDHRNAAPPPGVVRDAVEALPAGETDDGGSGAGAAAEPGGGWDTADAPAGRAGPGAPPPASRPVAGPRPESRRATVALILGAAGFVTIPVVVSVIAIVVANQALREIAADPELAGEQRARVGRVLGYIELTVVALTVLIGVLVAVTD